MVRVVYSSDKGRICPGCGHPADKCRCAKKDAVLPGDGIVRVRRETKGRKGKTVTLITGIPLQEDVLKQLASRLKRRCGSGGTCRGGTIEIQGDHVELLVGQLAGLGYTVRKSGS
jgi:translation initiation factor 1